VLIEVIWVLLISLGEQGIDTATETLILKSAEDISVDRVGAALPASEPCTSLPNITNIYDYSISTDITTGYAFFAWPGASSTTPTRQISTSRPFPLSTPTYH
jgi:hypothetical protein